MNVVEGFFDLPPAAGGCVATIGNFDGAHLGHQRVFARVREAADAAGLPAAAILFDPHPLKVLRPESAPKMILTRRQKIEIFQAAGFDELVFIPFSLRVAAVEPEAFVEEFLALRVGVKRLLIGLDFRFGRARRGDVDLLRREGARHGLLVESVETVEHGGLRISASRIRDALVTGQVRTAWELMGRPYEADGLVVPGAGRGRGQGAPTANLQVENELIPASGVYITWTRIEGEDPGPASTALPGSNDTARGWHGLANLGTRPTFEGADFTVENWLPDFSGDLYGRHLRVRFLERIRDERKFPDPAALREQIGRDLQTMREWFTRRG